MTEIAINDPAMVGRQKFERVANDAYFTPTWCVDALLSRWIPVGTVWDHAAGNSAIVEVLGKAGLDVIASDINEYADIRCDIAISRHDFMTVAPPSGLFSIVTNPPYELAEEFIRRALKLTKPRRGSVAMLLRHEFDCAKTRRDLFEADNFARKIVLTKRPRWFSGTTTSPRHNFSWFVWDGMHRGPAILEYAP